MSQELTVKNQEILSAIDNKGIDSVLKPLVKEIYLFDAHIAGTSYVDDTSVFKKLIANEKLFLVREDNRFDKKAIMVQNADKIKLGYIPEKDNVVFSRLMDAGKMLTARVKSISLNEKYNDIIIGIYLIDF